MDLNLNEYNLTSLERSMLVRSWRVVRPPMISSSPLSLYLGQLLISLVGSMSSAEIALKCPTNRVQLKFVTPLLRQHCHLRLIDRRFGAPPPCGLSSNTLPFNRLPWSPSTLHLPPSSRPSEMLSALLITLATASSTLAAASLNSALHRVRPLSPSLWTRLRP